MIPTRTEPSFLEQLAKRTPRDHPLTDRDLLDLLRSGDLKLPPFIVFPPNGPAPLKVEVRWSVINNSRPAVVEFDPEGNGSYQSADGRFDEHSGIQEGKFIRTYERAGAYRATLRVHDETGHVTTHTRTIDVKPKAVFETEIKSIWADFKAALVQGNLQAALNCTHASAREKYTQILPEVIKSRTPINEILRDIEFVNLLAGQAEFRMLIQEGKDLISYMVLFQLDNDGVWRIKFF